MSATVATRASSARAPLDRAMYALLDAASMALQGSLCCAVTVDEPAGKSRSWTSSQALGSRTHRSRCVSPQGLADIVALTAVEPLIRNAGRNTRAASFGRGESTSLIVAPIVCGERIIGVISAVRARPLAVRSRALAILGRFAVIAGQIIIGEAKVTVGDDYSPGNTATLSEVSHDMRTPLTVISALTSLLLSDKAGTLQPLQRDFLTSIQLGVRQLTRLAEHILDLYQAEMGELRICREPLQMAGIMADAVERMRPEAARAGVHLECGGELSLPLVRADRRRFEQVLTNLLGCAIRATSEGGNIAVKAERLGEELKVVVESAGYQLPARETDREGDERGRVDTGQGSSPNGKLGLALQVSKLIIEHHGGRLWVEGGKGAGPRFCFALQT